MTRYSIDTDGVSRERLALAEDPVQLRECASAVAAAAAAAMAAAGREGDGIRFALERFRAVHAYALDAVADAANALGDRLDRSTLEARSVDLFVTSALAQVATAGPSGSNLSAPSDAR
ncbi:hypothetical protein [Terrabacter sp. NPDC080008]|uniref:hypothetical protein n=1 Tax=Terrabacter sp. NPDC080008 TaxID=3155176 RepID=UPI00344EE177